MKEKDYLPGIIAVVSVFAALLLVLTGCGNSKKSSSAKQ